MKHHKINICTFTFKEIQYEYCIHSASHYTPLIYRHGGDQKFEIKSHDTEECKRVLFNTEVVLI